MNFCERPSRPIESLPSAISTSRPPAVNVPANSELLGILRDVDEAAGAGKPRPEAADVDVALCIGLRHAEAGKVEAAAVVEVELLVLLDDGFGIECRAEVEPTLRNTADDPGLGRERHVFEDPLLAATAATPSGMPMPRFTTPPSGSSNAQRRAMILRSSSCIGSMRSSGTRCRPEKAWL